MQFLAVRFVAAFVWVALGSNLAKSSIEFSLGRVAVHLADEAVECSNAQQDLDEGSLSELPLVHTSHALQEGRR